MGVFGGAAKAALKEGIGNLPDGEYTLTLGGCKLIERSGGAVLFQFQGQVLDGPRDGHKVTWELFVMGEDKEPARGMSQMLNELEVLGFPAKEWAETDDVGETLEANLKLIQTAIGGLRAKIRKKINVSNGKTYHNVDILAREPGDGKPPRFTDDDIKAANQAAIPF